MVRQSDARREFYRRKQGLKDRIVQIHVDNGGELILIPREGKERFNIGQPVNIKDKFDRMATYYTAIAANREGQAYRTVTLKYDGQIVCR